MACQESNELQPDGTWRPRYKNLVRRPQHKPMLLVQWGQWVCVSHNARGVGPHGDLTAWGAKIAWEQWKYRMAANERRERQEREHRAARPWLRSRT